MLGFLFRVAAGTVKIGVKYVVVPALVAVAITIAAEALTDSIRENTPAAPEHDGVEHRRRAKKTTVKVTRSSA